MQHVIKLTLYDLPDQQKQLFWGWLGHSPYS